MSEKKVDDGEGQREEVGGSGVYPASAGEAPEDAEVRTQGGWGRRGGKPDEPARKRPAPRTAPLSAPDSRVTRE